ncbi:hypothetical protein K469DRAFT_714161 [Zopfia rhizophila CBS 207.26]|uniref:Ankyrin n=1 Tax=Zopfia rhizophila CBS 207.26 TaxID=1314779 RepID=A0A6A6DTG6_9PEZI|nr:hypothetical protein K469DRAFT_714161 [Zopfia rhizophila CBS 207.26]
MSSRKYDDLLADMEDQDYTPDVDDEPKTPDLQDEENSPDRRLYEAVEADDLDAARAALASGANPNRKYDFEPISTYAKSTAVITLLVKNGVDASKYKMSDPTRRLLLGFPTNDQYDENALASVTFEQFREGRSRHYGTSNPGKMDIPFWNAMVETGCQAWDARRKFTPRDTEVVDDAEKDYTSPATYWGVAIWCADRWGQSLTRLPDGRIVQIAGEHEDSYDPDFMIYNDVFVHYPHAAPGEPKFEIYGYPEEVFPRTDFHTATYHAPSNSIIVIGNLGHRDGDIEVRQKKGETQGFRLKVGSWEMERLNSSGDGPGWICRHKAELCGEEIWVSGGERWVEENGDQECIKYQEDDVWVLDLGQLKWRKEGGPFGNTSRS